VTDSKKQMGRPKKLKDRRATVTFYITGSLLDTVDEYVDGRKAENRDYSRSDFANEAFQRYLRELGIALEGDDDEEEKQV
jgi:hypothetical protein